VLHRGGQAFGRGGEQLHIRREGGGTTPTNEGIFPTTLGHRENNNKERLNGILVKKFYLTGKLGGSFFKGWGRLRSRLRKSFNSKEVQVPLGQRIVEAPRILGQEIRTICGAKRRGYLQL